MRPARPVTGTAAYAVTIATLGFLAAGPSAYAGDADALRTGAAGAVSRTTGDLAARVTTADEAGGDETGGDEARGDGTGSGTDNPFSLDTLSGLDTPSLLSGLNLASGRDNPSGNAETDRGQGTDRGEDAGQDEDAGRAEGSGGHEGRSPSEEEGSGKHDGSSSGHDSSSSGHSPGDTPRGPTGHVETGVGGSVRPDNTQIAAGAGVLAVAAVGGAWLLRRRASGTQGAG